MPIPHRVAPFIIQPNPNLLDLHPYLRHNSEARARAYARGDFVTDESLQAMGAQLWQVLGIDDAFAQARQQAGAQTLPLIIASPDAALQQLPWETLHHPTFGFLGLANGFTLLRGDGNHSRTRPLLEAGPLRVLLFTMLPDDLDAEKSRLDVEEEQAQVLEALGPWVAEGVVKLEVPDDGRFATLQKLLKEFRPHLLFLSGHGKFHHEPHRGAAPYASLLFEGEAGGSHPVHETQIANALLGSNVGCVVLSACESGMSASDALNHGLTWRLSQIGIPHVIGMRESVLDRAGTLFVRAFGDAVARQQPVDEALQAARQAITTPLKASPWLGGDASGLAERSLGQWSLPTLVSHDPAHPLIDWHFVPQPLPRQLNQTLHTVSLPPRFVGRRRELRNLQSQLQQGHLHQLLISGPGGQGKTALAGKVAQLLAQRGYPIFAWSARPENPWRKFEFALLLALSKERKENYTAMLPLCTSEEEKADLLLRLSMEQGNGRLLLFFDNLESCQSPASQQLTDERLAAWIKAAQGLTGQGLILLLTSRWQLPGWPDADHLPLTHAAYGDWLQMANRILPLGLLQRRPWLRQLYTALHGNGRGLTFFAAASQHMTPPEESTFQEKLAAAAADTQTDMALQEIVHHLPAECATLLQRLPAYQSPVPLEGIVKVALDLPDPAAHLQRLLAVSLVEPSFAHDLACTEYQLSPLLAAWLSRQGVAPPDLPLLRQAAAYQAYLLAHERRSLTQAMVTHAALGRAEQVEAADRLALDRIVGRLSLQGLYQTLLDDWLPAICASNDPQIRAEALGQFGKQCIHTGQYETALRYLEQSLKISQEIGDRSGEGTTLNNISQIYDARGDYETALRYLEQSLKISQEIGDRSGEGTTLNNLATTAHARGDYETALRYLEQSLKIRQEIGDVAGLSATLFNMGHIFLQNKQVQEAVGAWVTVYRLAKPIGLANVLQALEGLAGSLGLAGGLAGWEELSQRMGE